MKEMLNEKRVGLLASKGLTMSEIAAAENVSEDTIRANFAEAYAKGREWLEVKLSHRLAERGNRKSR